MEAEGRHRQFRVRWDEETDRWETQTERETHQVQNQSRAKWIGNKFESRNLLCALDEYSNNFVIYQNLNRNHDRICNNQRIYANGSFFPGQEKNTQINYFKFSKFVLHLHTHILYRIVSSPALPFRYRWLNFLSNRVPFMHTHRPSMIHIVRLSEQHQHTKEWKCACVCAWFTFNPFNEWWNFLLRYNFTHSTCFPSLEYVAKDERALAILLPAKPIAQENMWKYQMCLYAKPTNTQWQVNTCAVEPAAACDRSQF